MSGPLAGKLKERNLAQAEGPTVSPPSESQEPVAESAPKKPKHKRSHDKRRAEEMKLAQGGFRLPDQSCFTARYDASTEEWCVVLTADGQTFDGRFDVKPVKPRRSAKGAV